MKQHNKIPSLLLAAALPLSLAACGQQEQPAAAAPERSAVEAAPVPASSTEATPTPKAASAPAEPESEQPRFAADYAEILASLSAARGGSSGMARGLGVNTAATADLGAVEEEAEAGMGAAPADGLGGGYSGTNVQVEGIDEGDIVKTDGTYIYVLNGSYTLTILRANGADSALMSQTVVGEGTSESWEKGYSYMGKDPREMFVSDGVLAVISDYYNYSSWGDDGDKWHWDEENYVCVDFFDVSEPAAPRLMASLGQDGNLLGSRLLDGRLYLVTNRWVWDYDEDEVRTFIPCFYEAGAARPMAAGDIAICPGSSTGYVVAGCYDFAGAALEDSQSLLGSGSEVYMKGDSLYVLGSRWEEQELSSYTESVYTVTQYRSGPVTDIFRFDLGEGVALAASGSVPGYADSQFSADEYEGYLRFVATRDESNYRIYEDKTYDFRNYVWDENGSATGLYILDRDLNLVGSITDLAEGEQVYSARFDGPIAYFSTFRSIDPLFAADCSDPANPVILSALKISGFSEYLHPWASDRLFGFGREADEETGRAGGLKLVMFDTSDKTDVFAAHTLELDDRYSEALYNHRAFFIAPEKNIIGFLAGERYYIFSYDEATGFTALGEFDMEGEYNARGLYIGENAYLVGMQRLVALDMDSWTQLGVFEIGAEE